MAVGTANAGRAVFEAVADFSDLIGQGKRAEVQMDRTKRSAEGMGRSIPADGGPAARGVSRIGARADELAGKFNRAGNRLSIGLTAPLTLLGGVAVRTFANFESSITAAGLKAGATRGELEQMKKTALDMGAKTKFSAGEAAGAMDQLAALGFNAQQSIGALPAVMQAAQASGEDLATTTDTVAKAMNAFNIDTKDATHVADVFAQASNTSALSMQSIADGMAGAGEVGARFGQQMEGVVAWLGQLVDKGVPAASAGVAIRQALTSLSAPKSKAASKIMKDLGIEVRTANGDMKQAPALLQEFSKALSLGNPKMKAAAKEAGITGQAYRDLALKQIFGVEGAKAFALGMSKGKPLLLDTQKDVKKLDDLQAGLAKTMGEKGAKAWIDARTSMGKFRASGADAVTAITEIDKASDGVSKSISDAMGQTQKQKIDNLVGSLQTFAIMLVSTVAPELAKVTDKATKFVNKIGEFTDKHDWAGPVIVGAGLLLAALGPVAKIVGLISGGIAGISKAGRHLGGFKAGSTGKTILGAAKPQAVFWTEPLPVTVVGGGAGIPGGGGGKGTPPVVGGPAGKAPKAFPFGGLALALGLGGATAGGLVDTKRGPEEITGKKGSFVIDDEFLKTHVVVNGHWYTKAGWAKAQQDSRDAWAGLLKVPSGPKIPVSGVPKSIAAVSPQGTLNKLLGIAEPSASQFGSWNKFFTGVARGTGKSKEKVHDLHVALNGLRPRTVKISAQTEAAQAKIDRLIAGIAQIHDKSFKITGSTNANLAEAVGTNAGGTKDWRGGWTWTGEHGKELVWLPKHSQVVSHGESMSLMKQLSAAQGSRTSAAGVGSPGGAPSYRAAQTNRSAGVQSLTIPVYNPRPEPASQSVTRVIRRVVDDEGWAEG